MWLENCELRANIQFSMMHIIPVYIFLFTYKEVDKNKPKNNPCTPEISRNIIVKENTAYMKQKSHRCFTVTLEF